MTIVGYARVSTRDQDLAGQLAELKAAGCELVYREKVRVPLPTGRSWPGWFGSSSAATP